MRETHIRSEKNRIKIIVLIALLFAVLLFLFIERDYLRNENREHLVPEYTELPTQSELVDGSHVIEQAVTMRTDSIKTIHVYFLNPDGAATTGKIKLELIDSRGNRVAETGIDASLVKGNKYTNFAFGVDAETINANRIVTLIS